MKIDTVRSADSIVTWLIAEIAKVSDLDPRALSADDPFSRCGLDSVGIVSLLTRLGLAIGSAVPPTLAWEYPTPAALARFLSGARPEAVPEVAEESLLRASAEPIAVVGMACRFSGSPNIAAFWRLLCEGRNAITEVPSERWDASAFYDPDPAAPGKLSTRWGGFIDGVAGFDPLFFGISPREARQMDPQQRLILQLAWEALEDANIPSSTLVGTRTGVYIGVIWSDYAKLLYQNGVHAIDPYTVTGHHYSLIANRVSYHLGLQGPSLALDTACSSSLVAVHLACESLRRGESTIALAGGVNLMLSVQSAIGTAKLGVLSPGGRCYAFDQRASGTVRGEGGGVVVLKRLSQALRDGDEIYCVLRGSAVNNDGASNGLSAPNPLAQQALLRKAYAEAKVEPEAVQYVEAHGTGTLLGDPIEAGALGTVLSARRPSDQPLLIGSVKTNIGHLEGAAGIAGLIKVALSLRNRQIPPSLNFEIPNALIPFTALRLEVAQTLRGWPRPDQPLIGGISSFGLGGTNCHLVMQESTPPRPELLTLSADSPEALGLTADRVLSGLASLSAPLPLSSLCSFMAAHLSDGAYRVAVTGRSLTELQRRLQDFLAQVSAPGLAVGSRPVGATPRLAFVFSGQGAQWLGMGRTLLVSEPVFRAKLLECDRLVQQYLGWSLLAELSSAKEDSRLDRIDVSLPAIISLEIATAALWRSWGIEPAAVVGHSTGEIAAAHVAGALSLGDTMRVICAYGRVIYRQRGQGAMGVVALGWEEAAAALLGYQGKVYRAIQHSTDSTVLAGEPAALSEVFAALRKRGIYCQQVRMDVAPHCPLVDSLRAELLAAVQEIQPRPTTVPLISEVTGSCLSGERLDAAHWVRNFAEPAYFSTAINTLLEQDCSLFLDVSPQPIVRHAIEANLRHAGRAGAVLASLRRADDERGALLETLGALYTRGFSPHWAAIHPALPEALRRHHEECFTEALAVSGALSAERKGSRGNPPAGAASSSPLCLPLSAKSAAALRAQAGQYAKHLAEHAEQSLHDIAFTASTRRDHHAHRLAVVSDSKEEVVAALAAYSRGELPPKVLTSQGPSMARPKVVFVFPGLGSQWLGMGRTLLAAEEVFRSALEQCDRVIQEIAGFSVVHELLAEQTSSRLELHEVIQPVMFSLQIALAALWRSWGIQPDAIVGHSMGEIAGAQVAGALSLPDAALIICARSRIGQRVQQPGAMMLVELSPQQAEAAIQGLADQVSIAAYNAPRATVLAGAPAALDELAALLEQRQVFIRRIKVAVAAHSPQLDPVLPELREQLKGVQARATQLALYSTVTEQRVEGSELDADYWVKNFRLPVLFSQAVQRLIDDGFQLFLELSPHPILLPAIAENLQAKQSPGLALGSLRRSAPARQCLLESLSGLYTRGYPVDFGRIYAHGGRVVTLPSYPWQNERYWVELQADPTPRDTPAAAAPGKTAEPSEQADPLAQCLYQVDWLLAPQAAAAPVSPLSILLFSDSAGSADSVISSLSSLSSLPARFIRVLPGSDFKRSSADSFLINPLEPEHYQRLLHLCFPDAAPCAAAWHLWSLDCPCSPPAEDSASSLSLNPAVACASAAFLAQALLGHGWRDLPSLLLLTRGAVPMTEPLCPQSPIALLQAPLWGLGRSLSLEHPELPCKLIDLSPAPLSPELLRAELFAQDPESQVALRSSGRYLARFAPGHWPVSLGHARPVSTAEPWVRPEASYLITGGLSGLGLRLAQDLVANGARHLVLVSRSQPSAQAAELIELWRQSGVQVLASSTDVADARQLAGLFAVVETDFPPLRGIVHCAAVLDDQPVLRLSTESFARTFAPSGGQRLPGCAGARASAAGPAGHEHPVGSLLRGRTGRSHGPAGPPQRLSGPGQPVARGGTVGPGSPPGRAAAAGHRRSPQPPPVGPVLSAAGRFALLCQPAKAWRSARPGQGPEPAAAAVAGGGAASRAPPAP